MQGKGILVDHSTTFIWVKQYAPVLNSNFRKHLRPTNALGEWMKLT